MDLWIDGHLSVRRKYWFGKDFSVEAAMSAAEARRQEAYEHLLTCTICTSLFDDFDHQPKCLPCNHTFCKACLREYTKQMGEDINCPTCRHPATIPAAGVSALTTNIYVKHLQLLVYDGSPTTTGQETPSCEAHPEERQDLFCKECERSMCSLCCDKTKESPCAAHRVIPLSAAMEETFNHLEFTFKETTTTVARRKKATEALMQELAEEKDQALLRINNVFDRHMQALHKRATLLKNKVIDTYSEHFNRLKDELDEVSTAMSCIVSLKEHYENGLQPNNVMETYRGLEEMREVASNIQGKWHLQSVKIAFDDKHGADTYRMCVTDLGRVKLLRQQPETKQPEPKVQTDTTSSSTEDLSPEGPAVKRLPKAEAGCADGLDGL